MRLRECFILATYIQYKPKLLGKGYKTISWVHFATSCGFNKIFIPNNIHHHFWSKLLQEHKFIAIHIKLI